MIGVVVLWFALAATVGSVVAYALAVNKKRLVVTGRLLFVAAGVAILLASAMFMTYILQHRFEYGYISSYSSRDLPLSLLITTFWAGQEGSFLLWALFATLIGAFLVRYAEKKQLEPEVMAVYGGVLAALLLFLCARSPFEYIWDGQSGIARGTIPPDGRGLNPLLQNFWMIIHPPVLFLGFASLAVPFSLAMAGLWKKRFSDWIRQALPWVLFSAAALGAGLMLGGYWAYGVLGWGGWWGWDPVENSSLIPWIVSIILVHTMLIQLLTGRLVRINFILAVAAFLLVVYSTFLTRSGVLAESSVHSFVDPGMFAYVLLVLWLALSAGLGAGMIWKRWKEMRSDVPASPWMTRESMLGVAAVVMATSAAIILFGTSWPLLSKLLPFGKASVEPAFYDRTNLPLAALMVTLLGISLKVKWNEESRQGFVRRLIYPAGATVVGVALFIFFGMRDAGSIALATPALFALCVSLGHGLRLARQSPWLIGGALSHAGLAVLLLGIIASGRYGQKQAVALPLHEAKEVFGYKVTFVGREQTPDGKFRFLVTAEHNGAKEQLAPVMFETAYNNSLMRTPDYVSFLTRDFYVEPVSLEEGKPAQQIIQLIKGKPEQIGPLTVTFQRFEMGAHGASGMMGSGQMRIGAVLEVVTPEGKETVTPAATFAPNAQPSDMTPAMLRSGQLGFQLLGVHIDEDTRAVQLALTGPHAGGDASPPVLVTEVSVKPFMTFVWAAALLIVGGLSVALVRRIRVNNA